MKRIKRDEGDDVIIIESKPALSINELCQNIDKQTGESCKEYASIICLHCNLYLCYTHVEIHRIILINERDKITNEINQRICDLNQIIEQPDRIKKLIIEKIERKSQNKISLIEQMSYERFIDLKPFIIELRELLQPIKDLLCKTQSISLFQIRKLRENLLNFDENKQILLNNFVDSISIDQNQSVNRFNLSNLDTSCRQYQLTTHQTVFNEMTANEELILFNDREHLLLFNLNSTLDNNFMPELIEWKANLHGKILDLHYCFYFKLFFILTDEKFISYQYLSTLNCLYRFTSHPWSCTTVFDSIFILYKYSTLIEQYTFYSATSTIQLVKQWQLNEMMSDCQHIRCIRTNPNQSQIAILIENDECRWRIAFFDIDMNCFHQTDVLPNASTVDWNLRFSFITDEQLLVMDSTTQNIYLVSVTHHSSSIDMKHYSDTGFPVNACTTRKNGIYRFLFEMYYETSEGVLELQSVPNSFDDEIDEENQDEMMTVKQGRKRRRNEAVILKQENQTYQLRRQQPKRAAATYVNESNAKQRKIDEVFFPRRSPRKSAKPTNTIVPPIPINDNEHCPICDRIIPNDILEIHTNACAVKNNETSKKLIEKSQQRTKTEAKIKEVLFQKTTRSSLINHLNRTNSETTTCPTCGMQMTVTRLENQHKNECSNTLN